MGVDNVDAIREFFSSLDAVTLWLLGGVVAEMLLQVVRRYVWNPSDLDYGKAKKLIAAVLVSGVMAWVAGGPFLAAWLTIFLAAVGYHEVSDKTGVKKLWAKALRK